MINQIVKNEILFAYFKNESKNSKGPSCAITENYFINRIV